MMMMIGENPRLNPTVQVPPWDYSDDPTADFSSPFPSSGSSLGNAGSPNGDSNCSHFDALTALHRYLPSNNDFAGGGGGGGDDLDVPVDAFSCDHFRMFEFKVRKCARGRSHDWTECPYAHPGEKARRRDPRKYHYSGTACPEFRKGLCKKGDSCEYAHGVFECWLHPARYRTQPCKDGTHCRRRVCFFAHTPEQLRVLPQNSPRTSDSYDGSPNRVGFESYFSKGSFGSSPTSTLFSPPVSPPSESPPMSPSGSLSELTNAMRNLQIGKSAMSMSPHSWGAAPIGSGFCSPRSPSSLRPGFLSLPSTPTRNRTRSGLGVFDLWDRNNNSNNYGEEIVMERVESGKELRAKIYAKLSKENSLDRTDPASTGPNVDWVSELVK